MEQSTVKRYPFLDSPVSGLRRVDSVRCAVASILAGRLCVCGYFPCKTFAQYPSGVEKKPYMHMHMT